jgi:hypothetical protein
MVTMRQLLALGSVVTLLGVSCASPPPRFPLQPSMTKDTDLLPVFAPCHVEGTKKDPHHVACSPEVYVSPLAWDAANQILFRPLSHAFAVAPGREAPNVTAFDEVLDSAWFQNRLGIHAMTLEELGRGACKPEQILETDHLSDGAWNIDKGKTDGSTPGFRMTVPGKGKFLVKIDSDTGGDMVEGEVVPHTERPTAASVVGAAAYHAVGFNTSCEQIVYVPRSVFKLTPGLVTRDNSGVERKFDQAALDKVLAMTTKKGDLLRFSASAWLPGHLIGPFRYNGTRSDDPNDIINHDDRRELRGGRLLAAWLDHFDAREQNTMDTWIATTPGAADDSSPGFVKHHYLDTSDCLGSEWDWDPVSRRLGHSYLLDWADLSRDFVTLGVPTRPWDIVERTPGHVKFGYFNVRDFDPELWKNEYPNAAFSRMTEHDGAWMARILARFTPAMVHELAVMGKFSDASDTEFLATVLEGRLEKILLRYLSRLSPLANVRVENGDSLCAVDLAEQRRLTGDTSFRYEARILRGPALAVSRAGDGGICVALPRLVTDRASPSDPSAPYVTVVVSDGFAAGALLVHLYDLGPARGYVVAGVERPGP